MTRMFITDEGWQDELMWFDGGELGGTSGVDKNMARDVISEVNININEFYLLI